ncbi:MAG: class I SAM-dependent methyltransferase [Nitrospirae bacterium]|nr:class I SAM-dependent methyltransferase [Nitrospirota bacterium]
MTQLGVRMMTTDCPLCGSDAWRPIMRAREYVYPEQTEFQLAQCRPCGHVFTNPRPSPDTMGAYYPTGTWTAPSRGNKLEDYRIGGLPWREAMRRRAEGIMRHARPPGTLLDIGCGDGLFLHHMREQGWKVEGVEPGGPAGAYARGTLGLKIHPGSAENVTLPSDRYSVVSLHHSLEHTNDPRRVLCSVRAALRPEGLLHVRVPNFSSLDRRLFGKSWVGLYVPCHLHHFTPGRLVRLVRECGFRVLELRFVSNETLWPFFYSDSLRRALAWVGLYTVAPIGGDNDTTTGRTAPTGDMFSSPNPLLRLAHRLEYAVFRAVGAAMDVAQLGSTVTVLAQAERAESAPLTT